MIKTPLTIIKCKWGHFDREKPIFKLMPVLSRHYVNIGVKIFPKYVLQNIKFGELKKKSAARVLVPDDWINLTV